MSGWESVVRQARHERVGALRRYMNELGAVGVSGDTADGRVYTWRRVAREDLAA